MIVACLTNTTNRRYKIIAHAMAEGVKACGDVAKIELLRARPAADVAVMYGWKLNQYLHGYPQFVYADLGFWHRETHYRMTANAWGPEAYVHQGLPHDRMKSFGVQVKPWKAGGDEVLLVGSTRKSATLHGLGYMEWEERTAKRLRDLGHRVIYRPKPNDRDKMPLEGFEYDERPIEESLHRARAVVTHHSNVAVQALVEGVPVHCEIGAGAAFSNPLEDLFERRPGRTQFLADVAWLQWSVPEMKSGVCWSHMKERGIIRC